MKGNGIVRYLTAVAVRHFISPHAAGDNQMQLMSVHV